MKLAWIHCRFQILQTLRLPIAAVPIIVFPALFFAMFGAAPADEPAIAAFTTASFMVFAALIVALFQFGAGLAEDRDKPWEPYVRTLAVQSWQRSLGITGVALFFIIAGSIPVAIVSALLTPISVPVARWPLVALALLVGAVPMSLLGVTIGYAIPPKGAIAVANLALMILAFGGGLFIPPQFLPNWVANLSEWLPTRNWAELVWGAVAAQAPPLQQVLLFAGWTVVFALAARWAFRRDESQRYA